jgi:hypothetical protein
VYQVELATETGTMQFRAIKVLQGKAHPYRHDLESFFYVFIWICIRYGQEDGPTGQKQPRLAQSQVREGSGQRRQAYCEAGILGHMQKLPTSSAATHMAGFEDVTAEFAPEFCGLNDLAEELRNVLFRSQDLIPFTGAYEDRNIMCDEMISVFSKAISYLERESEVNA